MCVRVCVCSTGSDERAASNKSRCLARPPTGPAGPNRKKPNKVSVVVKGGWHPASLEPCVVVVAVVVAVVLLAPRAGPVWL